MGILLNRKLTKRNKTGEVDSEIIDFAYLAKSIIKMQNLSVLQCDFKTTLGTLSINDIDRFHITFFGQKLLDYIDVDFK